MSFFTTQCWPQVGLSPEWAEIHRNWAAIIHLAGVDRDSRALICSGDDEAAAVGSSPVTTSADSPRLLELMTPLMVTLPPPLSNEDAAFYRAYASKHREKENAEKNYIAFIFEEYCKRKSVEQKYTRGIQSMAEELAELQKREVPLHVRNAIAAVEEMEAEARVTVHHAYERFTEWIEEMQPQWLAAAKELEAESERKAAAKRAAMEAAKLALAQELAMGKKIAGGAPSPHEQPVKGDDMMHYEPEEALELSASELRRKAIKMLETEEDEVRRRRETQLERLKAEEESMRLNMERREAERIQQEASQRDDEFQQRYKALIAQENELQSRLAAREAGQRQAEEERRMTLEHIAAEEELLQRRMKEREDRRAASAEEKARLEALQKAELYDHVRAEEELLRQRLQKHEDAREAQRRSEREKEELAKKQQYEAVLRQQAELEERERQRAAHLALQKEQEEALRIAKERHLNQERGNQLAYLREQEELLKSRVRQAAVADIKAGEYSRLHQPAAVSPQYAPAPPMPPYASHSPYVVPPPAPVYGDPYRQAPQPYYAPPAWPSQPQPPVVAPPPMPIQPPWNQQQQQQQQQQYYYQQQPQYPPHY